MADEKTILRSVKIHCVKPLQEAFTWTIIFNEFRENTEAAVEKCLFWINVLLENHTGTVPVILG